MPDRLAADLEQEPNTGRMVPIERRDIPFRGGSCALQEPSEPAGGARTDSESKNLDSAGIGSRFEQPLLLQFIAQIGFFIAYEYLEIGPVVRRGGIEPIRREIGSSAFGEDLIREGQQPDPQLPTVELSREVAGGRLDPEESGTAPLVLEVKPVE